jgi:hypothetical protein
MTTDTKSSIPNEIDSRLPARIVEEGYGRGAWHGPDLKAALAGVETDLAFCRPSPSRHNIAEIALHHGYYARSVRGQLSGLSQLDQAAAESAADGFGSGRSAELSENRADMEFDRVLGNVQPRGDFFVAEAVCKKAEDFAFARCEVFWP